MLAADVEIVWLATQVPDKAPAAPKAGVQSLTLVVMVRARGNTRFVSLRHIVDGL